MKYFKLKDFNCPCCGKNNMNKDVLSRLDIARYIAGVKFIISSGYRCVKHNKEVGGSKDSSHLIGVAVDIKCKKSYNRFRIIYGLILAGFTRIGIGKNFIHADYNENKVQEVTWLY